MTTQWVNLPGGGQAPVSDVAIPYEQKLSSAVESYRRQRAEQPELIAALDGVADFITDKTLRGLNDADPEVVLKVALNVLEVVGLQMTMFGVSMSVALNTVTLVALRNAGHLEPTSPAPPP